MNATNPTHLNTASLGNYNDLNALQSIKQINRSDKEASIEAVAKQFESIFVSMMIKGMRDANKAFSEGNMLQSNQSEFYQQMFDSQLAVSLSTGNGLGLAEVIEKQLSRGLSPEEAKRQGIDLNKAYSLDGYQRKAFPTHMTPEKIAEAVSKIDEVVESLPEQNLTTALPEAGKDKVSNVDFSSPRKFIESLYPLAKNAERETGIDARLMLAQSALETGWGQHQIVKENGQPSFNLFGIKAHDSWGGDVAEIVTTEYRQGIPMKERAEFRSYDSYDESFKDYAQFLKQNSRYDNAFEHASDPKAFAQALQASGYATDPRYGDKVGQILDKYFDAQSLTDAREL